ASTNSSAFAKQFDRIARDELSDYLRATVPCQNSVPAGRWATVMRARSAMSLVLALLSALRAALRTRTDLTLENLALRQQLALLRRRSKQPKFGLLDRVFWMLSLAKTRSDMVEHR